MKKFVECKPVGCNLRNYDATKKKYNDTLIFARAATLTYCIIQALYMTVTILHIRIR